MSSWWDNVFELNEEQSYEYDGFEKETPTNYEVGNVSNYNAAFQDNAFVSPFDDVYNYNLGDDHVASNNKFGDCSQAGYYNMDTYDYTQFASIPEGNYGHSQYIPDLNVPYAGNDNVGSGEGFVGDGGDKGGRDAGHNGSRDGRANSNDNGKDVFTTNKVHNMI